MALINLGRPFLTSQAQDLGYTRWSLHRALAVGELRRVFRGVVVDAGVADDRASRLEALRLVVPPDAIVSDHTAAWVRMVDTFPPGDQREMRPMCVVPHGSHRPARSRALARQVVVPDAEAVEMSGILVTSGLRTTTDLLRRCWRPYALAAGDAMVRAQVVAVEDVAEQVLRLSRLPFLAQAQELAPRLNPLKASHGESWQDCRMMDAGFSLPTYQHKVTLADGRVRYLDAAFEAQRTASEYDGREFHSSQLRVEHDTARREEVAHEASWGFAVGTRETIFGTSTVFEQRLGELLGQTPRPRTW